MMLPPRKYKSFKTHALYLFMYSYNAIVVNLFSMSIFFNLLTLLKLPPYFYNKNRLCIVISLISLNLLSLRYLIDHYQFKYVKFKYNALALYVKYAFNF